MKMDKFSNLNETDDRLYPHFRQLLYSFRGNVEIEYLLNEIDDYFDTWYWAFNNLNISIGSEFSYMYARNDGLVNVHTYELKSATQESAKEFERLLNDCGYHDVFVFQKKRNWKFRCISK